MAAVLLICAVLLALPGTLPAQAVAAPEAAAPAASAESVETTLHAISAFSPREEGSPAEGALLDWIAAHVAGAGRQVQAFDFSHSDFEHSFSRNLRVDLPGRSRDSLLVVVPIDAPPGPGGDGSLGVALAVDLLDRLKGQTPPLSLVVLFLGAEFGDADPYPMGSTLFLHDFQPDYRASVLYLNLRGAPTRVLVRGSGRGIVTPYWLMKRCLDALEESRIPFRLQADEVQAFRLGATDERTQIEPWLKAGFPAVGVEGDYGAASGTPDILPALSTFLANFVSAGRAAAPEEWDRHYLLVQAFGQSLIVGETVSIAVLGGTLALFLLFALIRLRRLKKYTRTLVRYSGAIVPVAGLTFLFLVAGTYAVGAIPALRRFPDLWKYAPLEFLGLKICIALFLCAALYAPLRHLPFPRKGSFYSAAALLFLLVEIGVVASFDVTFTPYFLWAFLFVAASTLARNRWVKLAWALPAPLWAVRGIVMIFLLPAYPLSHVLTFSPLLGNLLVAGACLPFIFLILRLGLIFPGRGIMRRGVRELILAGLLFAVAGVETTRLLTYSPFSAANPQPLTATQTLVVDAAGRTSSTSLGIESPAPVRGVSLSTPEGTRPLPPGWSGGPLPLSPVDSPLRIAVGSAQFLQQLNLTLDVGMPSRPRSFSLTIDSEKDFVLFDSSFPALRVGPHSYRLLVGAFPPDPLSVQLSLPIEQSFTLTLTAEFDSPLIGVDVKARPDARVATRVRVVRTLEVRT
jgi:hypothetical protein